MSQDKSLSTSQKESLNQSDQMPLDQDEELDEEIDEEVDEGLDKVSLEEKKLIKYIKKEKWEQAKEWVESTPVTKMTIKVIDAVFNYENESFYEETPEKLDFMEHLFDHGYPIDKYGMKIIMEGAENDSMFINQFDTFSLFVRYGMNIEKDGFEYLMEIPHGDFGDDDYMPFINLFAQHKGDLNQQDSGGNALLHEYSGFHFEKIIARLIELGTDHTIRNHRGHIPLFGYLTSDNVCELDRKTISMLSKGIEWNKQDEKGNTLLHAITVSYYPHTNVVWHLSVFGVDPSIRNQEGQTALERYIRSRELAGHIGYPLDGKICEVLNPEFLKEHTKNWGLAIVYVDDTEHYLSSQAPCIKDGSLEHDTYFVHGSGHYSFYRENPKTAKITVLPISYCSADPPYKPTKWLMVNAEEEVVDNIYVFKVTEKQLAELNKKS